MFRTATALATLLMVSTPALAQEDWTEFYAKIYGGWTPPGTHWYDNLPAEPLRHGYLFGAALGVGVPGLDWLSVELDATVSSARYDGAFDNYLNGITVMADAVATFPINDMLDIYGGLGVGFVKATYDNFTPSGAFDASGFAPAAQGFAGVSFDITENFAVFGEVRYQTAIGRVTVSDPSANTYQLEWARTAALVGLRVSN